MNSRAREPVGVGRFVALVMIAAFSSEGCATSVVPVAVAPVAVVPVTAAPAVVEPRCANPIVDEAFFQREDSRRVVNLRNEEYTACYAQGHRAKADLEGELIVRLVIGADGVVCDAVVESDVTSLPAMERCFLELERSWVFPPAADGRPRIAHEVTHFLYLTRARTRALLVGAILAGARGDRLDAPTAHDSPLEARQRLLEDWNVKDRASALQTLQWLKSEGHSEVYRALKRQLGDLDAAQWERMRAYLTSSGHALVAARAAIVREPLSRANHQDLIAWDQGRRTYIVRLMRIADYITTAELWSELLDAARRTRAAYSSWKEFAEHYLFGRRFWAPEEDSTLQRRVVDELLGDGGAWTTVSWEEPLD